MTSGSFLGWKVGNDFYDPKGNRLGRFSGSRLFLDNGQQVGFVYDSERVGWKNGYQANSIGDRGTTTSKANVPPAEDPLPPNHNAAWTDPLI